MKGKIMMKLLITLPIVFLISCNGGGSGSTPPEDPPTEVQQPRVEMRRYVSTQFAYRFSQLAGIIDSSCSETDCIVSGVFNQFISENVIREIRFRGTLVKDFQTQKHSGEVELSTGQTLEMFFSSGQPSSLSNYSKCLIFANQTPSHIIYEQMMRGKTVITNDDRPTFFTDPNMGIDLNDPYCTN
jgi:hypothetical protein